MSFFRSYVFLTNQVNANIEIHGIYGGRGNMKKVFMTLGLVLALSLVLVTPVMAASVKVDLTPYNGAQGSAVVTFKDSKVDAATDSADLNVKLTLKDAVPNTNYWVYLKVDGGPPFQLGKAVTDKKGKGSFTGSATIDNLSNPVNHTFKLYVTSSGPDFHDGDIVFGMNDFITLPFK